MFVAVVWATYVSAMRASSVGYFSFWLLSLALDCPTEYGGLPTITRMGSSFWRFTRSELAEKTAESSVSPSSVIWKVSVSTAPSKGTYSPPMREW